MRFQLCLYQHPEWQHGPAFQEILESVNAGLVELGHEVIFQVNEIRPGYRTILFGAHILPLELVASLPSDTIIYNFEHAIPDHLWSQQDYWNWIGNFEVWEYNHENLRVLQTRFPAGRIRYVPMGFMPQLTRIDHAPEQDVDVLFFGNPSPRRLAILDELKLRGLNVVHLVGIFGAERDTWISRTKIALNIHMTQGGLFESPRIAYLLANRRFVVTECNRPTEIESDLAHGLLQAPYSQIVECCIHALKLPLLRKRTEDQGFIAINSIARRTSTILASAIGCLQGS